MTVENVVVARHYIESFNVGLDRVAEFWDPQRCACHRWITVRDGLIVRGREYATHDETLEAGAPPRGLDRRFRREAAVPNHSSIRVSR
jgi:ketosteroid isomerase-like protein